MTRQNAAPPAEDGQTSSRPGFIKTPRQSPPSARPPSQTTPDQGPMTTPDESPAGPVDGSASAAETPPSETTGPSPASTSPGPDRPAGWFDAGTRRAYEKSVRTIATAGSALVEARVGAGTGGFLMLPEEADDIAEPASRLLARHMPVAGTGPISDVGDVVALVVAAFGYLMNGLGRRAAVLFAADNPEAGFPNPEPGLRPAAQPEPTPTPGGTPPPWPAPARPPVIGTST